MPVWLVTWIQDGTDVRGMSRISAIDIVDARTKFIRANPNKIFCGAALDFSTAGMSSPTLDALP